MSTLHFPPAGSLIAHLVRRIVKVSRGKLSLWSLHVNFKGSQKTRLSRNGDEVSRG